MKPIARCEKGKIRVQGQILAELFHRRLMNIANPQENQQLFSLYDCKPGNLVFGNLSESLFHPSSIVSKDCLVCFEYAFVQIFAVTRLQWFALD